jgi:hypothetical protein
MRRFISGVACAALASALTAQCAGAQDKSPAPPKGTVQKVSPGATGQTGLQRQTQQRSATPAVQGNKAASQAQRTVAPTISEKIHDSALLKMLILDLQMNLVGVDWQSRENLGVGRTALRKTWEGLLAKYKHKGFDDFFGPETKRDGPEALEVNGSCSQERCVLPLDLPDTWFELIPTAPTSNLPPVKFKSGGVVLDLKTMTVSFKEGTMSMVQGEQYRYSGGKWEKVPPGTLK